MKAKFLLVFILFFFALVTINTKSCKAQTTIFVENNDMITLSDTVTRQVIFSAPLTNIQVALIRLDSANTGTVQFAIANWNTTNAVRSRFPAEKAGAQFYVSMRSGYTTTGRNLYVKASSGTTALLPQRIRISN